MYSAHSDDFAETPRTLFRRRIAGVALAIAIEILLVLLLLTLGPKEFGKPKGDGRPNTFQLAPERKADKPEKSATKKKQEKVATKSVVQPPPAAPVVPPVLNPNIPGLIVLTREQYAAADIGKIKSEPSQSADAGEGDSVAIGTGANGEPLFNAEWYREPRSAELQFYYPKSFRGGSALIVCKTAPKFHVEDCRSLGEDPPGTGLARGMINASWQFLVRPPRKGGKALIGALVRIQFDVTSSPAK